MPSTLAPSGDSGINTTPATPASAACTLAPSGDSGTNTTPATPASVACTLAPSGDSGTNTTPATPASAACTLALVANEQIGTKAVAFLLGIYVGINGGPLRCSTMMEDVSSSDPEPFVQNESR